MRARERLTEWNYTMLPSIGLVKYLNVTWNNIFNLAIHHFYHCFFIWSQYNLFINSDDCYNEIEVSCQAVHLYSDFVKRTGTKLPVVFYKRYVNLLVFRRLCIFDWLKMRMTFLSTKLALICVAFSWSLIFATTPASRNETLSQNCLNS